MWLLLQYSYSGRLALRGPDVWGCDNAGILGGRSQLFVECLKWYFILVFLFAIGFYILHTLVPYKFVPKDFEPPPKWIGSFSKGEFFGYITAVFLYPISIVVALALGFLNVSSEISGFVGGALLTATALVCGAISGKLDRQ